MNKHTLSSDVVGLSSMAASPRRHARTRRLSTKPSAVAIAAATLVGLMHAGPAVAATCTWNPASGDWNIAANWSCGFVPGNLDLAVIASGRSVTVTGGPAATALNNDGTVTIANNAGFGLIGTSTNNGVISMASVGNITDLSITGVVTLNGTGSIQSSNTAANRIYGAGTLILGAGQSILGSAQLGATGGLIIVNNGTVAATQGTPMTINTSGGVTNNNLLQANGGTLVVQGTNVTQGASGRLEGINGSIVQLFNASVSGGSFTSSGTGAVATASGTTNSVSGVTNSGTFNIVNNSFVNLDGNLVNNGSVNLQSAGNITNLNVTGARTISGNGTINLTDTQANRILGTGGTLTLGSGQTLQGAGTIGAGSAGFGLVNQGTVVASSGAGLLINAAAGVTNTGTLRADSGALQLQTTINSAGGNIQALNGSQVQMLNGTVINNANFSASGAGSVITTVSGATVSLGGGTVSGPMTVANNSFLWQTGDLVYNGTLNISSAGNLTDLRIQGTRSITGTATINMSDTQANRVIAASVSGDQLTLGNNVTLQGAGVLGGGGALAVVNNGTIVATSGAGLRVETTAGVTNNGVMRANGGPLQFRNVVVNSAGGTIEAVNGSQVQLENGTVINNANFSASSGGLITTVSGATVALGGGTVSGPMTVANNSFLRLDGDVTYNGVLSMASVGNLTDMRFNGARTISGTATINMSNTTANRLLAVNGSGDSVTIGNNVTVQGAGSIGGGSALAVINNGSLIATSGAGMVMSTTAGVTNNALIRGDNGTVTISDTQVNQGTNGVLNAINNGAVVLGNGSQINGGTFSTASGGEVAVRSGNTANVAGVTNTGTLNINNNARLNLNGTLTNNGTINLQSVGNVTDFRVSGNQSIVGSGTINMTNTTANRFYGAATGDGLTLGAGQTLQGSGSIGLVSGGFNFTNNGTVTANQSAPITMNTNGALTNAASGTMQATAGGTLNVDSALSNAGTLAANGGVVNANAAFNGTGTALISGAGRLSVGAASTVGTLTHNGSASNGLALGTNNITVSGDYTNANSGTGNAFNRRANVTGTGQILAGGNAAQAITGATVTNGNTANATLTINNVRVGTTSYDYQIANTGTTGPSLRGGIQTSVNGGNISDGRLSGSGVTASNYNTGGPGSNTGNLNVTFTAATAGALAPMTGQAVTLRSNFDNIADQRLNIVLGAGAAAYNAASGNAASPVVVANQRVGGTNTAGVAITNTAATGSFSEDLGATIGGTTGGVTGSGSVSGLVAGATNNGSMQVGVNTATAGAQSGTVVVNYQTLGTVNGVSNGLGVAGANGPQVVNVTGNVYQAAAGAIQTPTFNFGTLQVGQNISQALTIRNTATGPSGFVEDLNATFGSSGNSQISGSGSLNGILAGTNSTGANGAMNVTVTGITAGALNSTIGVNYFSAGAVNGVSNNLGLLAVGSENYAVNGTIQAVGNVINQASPLINTPTVNLGNVRVGDSSPTGNVSVTNVATAPPQAALNATISGNAPITATGSFNLLAPGATNASSLQVGMNTASAGAVNGTATVNFVSDASNVGNCAPNCQLNIGSQNVNVTGGVYQVAQPTIAGNVTVAAQRVGGSGTQGVGVTNTSVAPAGFQEGLNVNVTGTSGAATGGGTLVNLGQGNTNTTAIQVGVDSSVAGVRTGTVTLGLGSNGTGTSGLATLALPQQIVSVSGNVYNPAVVQLNTSTISFGIVHVGDVVAAQNVSVTNAAANMALNDVLRDTGGTAGAGFTVAGGLGGGLGAGATNASAFQVGLNTATAGVYSGNASIGFASHNAEMSDLSLGQRTIALSGTVNNYANAAFAAASGGFSFTGSGNNYVLDFGNITLGSGPLTASLNVLNDVVGPADLLEGSYAFDFQGLQDFNFSGFTNPFANLAAGASLGGYQVSFGNTSVLGGFVDEIILTAFGSNASGYRDAIGDVVRVTVRANVIDGGGGQVPVPPTIVLVALGMALLVGAKRRRQPRGPEQLH